MKRTVCIALAACDGAKMPEWGTGSTEITVPYPDDWSGSVVLTARPGVGVPPYADLNAWFFEPGHTSRYVVPTVVHDPFDGPDDCGLSEIRTDGIPLTAVLGGDAVPWGAGDLALTRPDGTVVPVDPWGPTQYFADLGPAVPGDYTLAASGDDVTAFADLPLTLPEPVELVEPDAFSGDTDIGWTGTSDGLLVLEIAYVPYSDPSNWVVHCELEDDGAFTLPAAIVDARPSDAFMLWSLKRGEVREVVLDGGEIIGVAGLAVY